MSAPTSVTKNFRHRIFQGSVVKKIFILAYISPCTCWVWAVCDDVLTAATFSFCILTFTNWCWPIFMHLFSWGTCLCIQQIPWLPEYIMNITNKPLLCSSFQFKYTWLEHKYKIHKYTFPDKSIYPKSIVCTDPPSHLWKMAVSQTMPHLMLQNIIKNEYHITLNMAMLL